MDILTLLRANIRHKKGSFVSIILLMVIISMSLTTIISINDNTQRSVENALDAVEAPDLTIMIQTWKLTDTLLESVNQNAMVADTACTPALVGENIRVGEKAYPSSCFLRQYAPCYKRINAARNGYEAESTPPSDGEIYLTLGVESALSCSIGDTVFIDTVFGTYDFKLSGYVAEPQNGSYLMGWKQLFISNNDFARLQADCAAKDAEKSAGAYTLLGVRKADDCDLSQLRFRRQLNLDTGITNQATGSLTRDQVVFYTGLYTETIMNALTVFIIMLLVIVLIVMRHSISTSIEMEYVSLGVLKSQGYTSRKIRLILALQYLFAQLIGVVIGTILSLPLIAVLGGVFQPVTALITEQGVSAGKVILVIVALLLISALFLVFSTRKISRLSPVRAISGGRSEVYFDSRFQMPIRQRGLTASLALRQFTAAKKKYAGILLVISILVFFMMTVMRLGALLDSKTALASVGVTFPDCSCTIKGDLSAAQTAELDEAIEEIVPITQRDGRTSRYMSINGEEIYALIHEDPTLLPAMLKGRAPIYDNEILITEILEDELSVHMGDTVTLANNDQQGEYLISGIFQCTNDTGRTFAMSMDGAKRLGVKQATTREYLFADASRAGEVAQMLNARYGDLVEATADNNGEDYMATFRLATDATKVVIYGFSVLFALVVVNMVCKKAFLMERTDIGIYKAIGFTTTRLRLQFAVRFAIVSVLGALAGAVLSLLFSERVLTLLLRRIGITSLKLQFHAATVLLPSALICLCFFGFSYLAARKIKGVSVQTLISE